VSFLQDIKKEALWAVAPLYGMPKVEGRSLTGRRGLQSGREFFYDVKEMSAIGACHRSNISSAPAKPKMLAKTHSPRPDFKSAPCPCQN